MKYTPFVDLLVMFLNIYFAIVNRGTVWGWLATAVVVFYVWIFIKVIREV